MAKVNYYLLSHGKLVRKHNTIYFYRLVDGNIEKSVLPIKKIHAIYSFGRVSVSSGVISYLAKHRIPIHFFNKYGVYIASLYPRKYLLSGYLLVKQVQHYLNFRKRMELAREFVRGSITNMIKNLERYKSSKDLDDEMRELEIFLKKVDSTRNINDLMGVEGNARHVYYTSFNKILDGRLIYTVRSKRPPETKLDALISFGNSLLYATVLSEIYHTQLDPTISFLHQPSERRYSLALDISEVFKPIIVDRTIFKLVNKSMLKDSDYVKDVNYVLLSNSGKSKFLREYEARLNKTVRHKTLRRHVSIQRMIRLECYKLIKHFIGTSKYKALTAWW